ncbi:MAG TPA: universal stress protein, partial [Pyrinomonadaceae bacterium]|nr:universal stress protein [Pyrinomonadaceae bacterium]
MLTSPEILVPIDFSPCSVNALRVAVGMAAPEGDLTLLHVVDEDFIKSAVAAGMGNTEDLRGRLKEQAEASFANVLEGIDTGN